MEVIDSKTYLLRDHPYAYVTLTDLGPGKGMIQIQSDWGHYSCFWNAIGDRTIREFLLSCDSGYIETNLKYSMNYLGVKQVAFGRLTKFMAHCWPKIVNALREEPSHD